MKSVVQASGGAGFRVAPLAGAWIEMVNLEANLKRVFVAPLAGAWIEIIVLSLECIATLVAPLAGAWIEIIVFRFV